MSGKEIVSYDGVHCANCTAPMHGEFCHECGQSIHTVLKPVHHMLEDTLETFLHVDGRALHTVPPLLTKPGFLTLEYFSGRRQRYVPPFRLMFVLCLLAFFLTHITIDALSTPETGTHTARMEAGEFEHLQTPDEVNHSLEQKLAGLREGRKQAADIPGVDPALLTAEIQLRQQAAVRLSELKQAHGGTDAAPASSAAAAAAAASAPAHASSALAHATSAPASASSASADTDEDDERGSRIKGKSHFKRFLTGNDRVEIAWLPGFMNTKLNHSVDNLRENLRGMNSNDPAVKDQAFERMKAGIFGALPQTMFVLMPMFALLLKLFYLFKRRLYMEHLIVALHSHAFLFVIVLLECVLILLKAWIEPHAAWAGQLLTWLEVALGLWAPVYLLLMQKRVYRQGWWMTSIKYLAIGWCYIWLLGYALAGAFVLGISH